MINVARVLEESVILRREIHADPETKFEVAGTVSKIRAFLSLNAGVKDESMFPCAENGLFVDLVGCGPADAAATAAAGTEVESLPPVAKVALRADTDALPMTEKNDHLPYRSKNEGLAHMCGHDGHIAALAAGACLIAARLDRLPIGKSVRLLFQPAEEGPGGALPMLQAGCLEGVDEVYGMHNWPTSPVGTMRVKAGALMAHVAEFTIKVIGKGTHGSQPQSGIDPVLAASAIVLALQSIVSRSLHSKDSAVVSVTMFHSGEVSNVIPDMAVLSGTIRDFDGKVFETIVSRLRAIATSTAAAYGATAEVDIEDGYPEVNNHEPQTAVVQAVGAAVLGPLLAARGWRNVGAPGGTPGGGAAAVPKVPEADVVSAADLPMAGAEDFSYYLMPEHGGKPGCFFFLGGHEAGLGGLSALPPSTVPGAFATPAANAARRRAAAEAALAASGALGQRTNCICHGTAYDFNDNAIPGAAAVWVRLVEARLGCVLYGDDELGPAALKAATSQAAEALVKRWTAGAGE